MLVDTHCHIHETDYPDANGALDRANDAGIEAMICVGTDVTSSYQARDFSTAHDTVYFSIGVHPHEAKHGYTDIAALAKTSSSGLVAVGEIGLDYFYDHSPRQTQIAAFEAQLQVASDNSLPVIFHVRETQNSGHNVSVWDDFWPIVANFRGIRGVLHSFTDSCTVMEKAVSAGFFIGVNGISTFARDKQAMFDAIPLEKMVLETDAPFLTPIPHRGTVNEPAFVRNVAEYHANRRGIALEHLARATSANARALFALSNIDTPK